MFVEGRGYTSCSGCASPARNQDTALLLLLGNANLILFSWFVPKVILGRYIHRMYEGILNPPREAADSRGGVPAFGQRFSCFRWISMRHVWWFFCLGWLLWSLRIREDYYRSIYHTHMYISKLARKTVWRCRMVLVVTYTVRGVPLIFCLGLFLGPLMFFLIPRIYHKKSMYEEASSEATLTGSTYFLLP